MTITDADRMAYDAPVLELQDGRRLRLHYGYGGLRRIEKHFGSLQGLTDKMSGGASGEFYDAVFMGLLCGLWQSGITEDDLERNLDPAQIEAHGKVLSEALMLAFPQQAQTTPSASEPSPASAPESPGPQTLTSLPPSSVSPLSTSGL